MKKMQEENELLKQQLLQAQSTSTAPAPAPPPPAPGPAPSAASIMAAPGRPGGAPNPMGGMLAGLGLGAAHLKAAGDRPMSSKSCVARQSTPLLSTSHRLGF